MRESRLDDLETCPDCGKLTEYDPCSGEPHASEGFGPGREYFGRWPVMKGEAADAAVPR